MDSKSIIFDIRSFFEQSEYSIINSYKMCCSSLYLKRFNNKTINISDFFINFDEINTKIENDYNIIIVINQHSSNYLNILKEYLNIHNKKYSIYELDEFIKISSIDSVIKLEKKEESVHNILENSIVNIISEIIPGLYLSGIDGINELEKHNISYVLSVMPKYPTLNEKYKHMKIEIFDSSDEYIEKYFEMAHTFIDEALKNNKNILVHCKAGISRSATIIISYIMKIYKMEVDDAIQFVRKSRPNIEPNFAFYASLLAYHKVLNLSST